jgi:hypothetical protein
MRGILLIADRSQEPKYDNNIVAGQRIFASHESDPVARSASAFDLCQYNHRRIKEN